MTPATAARLLELPVEATPAEIDVAYRRLSRAAHPDRYADQGDTATSEATRRFVQLTEARERLLREAAARRGEPTASIPPPYAGYETLSRPTRSRLALGTWIGLLLIALVVSVLDDSAELKGVDALVRLIPLAIAAIAFALTGSRVWLAIGLVLAAVSVGITIAFASFGPLLSLEILIVPLLGLGAMGFAERRRRARAQSSSAANQGG